MIVRYEVTSRDKIFQSLAFNNYRVINKANAKFVTYRDNTVDNFGIEIHNDIGINTINQSVAFLAFTSNSGSVNLNPIKNYPLWFVVSSYINSNDIIIREWNAPSIRIEEENGELRVEHDRKTKPRIFIGIL